MTDYPAIKIISFLLKAMSIIAVVGGFWYLLQDFSSYRAVETLYYPMGIIIAVAIPVYALAELLDVLVRIERNTRMLD